MGHYQELPKLVHPDFAVPNRKPVGAVEVDLSDDIGKDLLWYYTARTQNQIYQRGSGFQEDSFTSSAVTFTPKPDGLANSLDSGSGYFYTSDAFVLANIKRQSFTFFADFIYQGNTGNSQFVFANAGAASSTYNWGTYYHHGTASFISYIKIGGSATQTGTGLLSAVIGQRYRVVVTYDGANIRQFCNGGLYGEPSKTGNVDITSANLTFNRWNTLSYVQSDYYSAGVINRSLSQAEARAFSQNIYKLYKPRNPITYFIPSAGGGAYTLSGSSSISLTSSAGFTHNIHPSIAGGANVAVSPTGVLSYNQHPVISGAVSQLITSSATMTYASGNEILGDVTLTVQPTASLNYNEHHVITGDSSIAFSSSAAMSYVNAGAYEISGSVTVSATPSAALAYNQHPILSGDTTLYFVSAATMTYATPQEYLLSGASGIDVIPASVMSYVSILAAQYQGRRMTAKDRTRQMIATHKPRNMR